MRLCVSVCLPVWASAVCDCQTKTLALLQGPSAHRSLAPVAARRPNARSRAAAMAVAKGMRYEVHVARVLESMLGAAALVVRCGGANDRGVDVLADLGDMSIVVQCKNFGKRLGPQFVRELEASVADAQSSAASWQTLGLLASPEGFTKQAHLRAMAAAQPLGLVVLREGDALPSSLVLNAPAHMRLPQQLTVARATHEEQCTARRAVFPDASEAVGATAAASGLVSLHCWRA